MNPKFEEIKEQSYIQEIEYDIYRGHAPYYVSVFSEEKYGELIVRECVEYLRTTDFSEIGPNVVAETAANDLLNLFGLE